ncbi:glycine receptor subunit alpha-3-like [Oppia nitens]|uniref:glycine receptor subunit alpha-3-like n=1 Tax=Oppia nitens TaxID=1686743 RepID=UPI0023DB46D6|nr:glycine receptor subunit alpha-3-like [Oppia nitens]
MVSYYKCLAQQSKFQSDKDLNQLDRLLKGYDRRALPTSHLGIPTVVECEIFIRSIGSINPESMDYEVDLYLRQSWFDERLRTGNGSRAMDLNDPKLVQMIWKPEVFFANAKSAEFQYVTVPNVLVRLETGGKILYMLRLKLRFSCMMDLYRYPMDAQVCGIELASFSKTTSELMLKWSDISPIKLYDKLKLPQFLITNVNTTLCKETFHIGEYSCLKAEFYLQRALGYHLVQSYLPTILIVVISWVSFWLDVESIPARITLGVTTLLTISSKGAGIQSNLPPVSYAKAIDVWMGTCTTFVFVALLEFTLVNYLWRRNKLTPIRTVRLNNLSHTKKNIESMNSINNKLLTVSEDTNSELRDLSMTTASIGDVGYCSSGSAGGVSNGDDCSRRTPEKIDSISRIGFPVFFIVFNLIYWPYYLILIAP